MALFLSTLRELISLISRNSGLHTAYTLIISGGCIQCCLSSRAGARSITSRYDSKYCGNKLEDSL